MWGLRGPPRRPPPLQGANRSSNWGSSLNRTVVRKIRAGQGDGGEVAPPLHLVTADERSVVQGGRMRPLGAGARTDPERSGAEAGVGRRRGAAAPAGRAFDGMDAAILTPHVGAAAPDEAALQRHLEDPDRSRQIGERREPEGRSDPRIASSRSARPRGEFAGMPSRANSGKPAGRSMHRPGYGVRLDRRWRATWERSEYRSA